MKKHTWPVSILLATLPLLGALSGCGGGSSTTTPGSTTGGGSGNTSTDGKAVTGQLLRADQNGAGLAKATVMLVPAGKAAGSLHTRAVNPTQTDANGNYQFTNVPTGSYTVQAVTSDGSYQEADVPITVQQATQVPPIGLIPNAVQLDHINIVLPAADGANNNYVVQHNYTFTAEVFDKSGNKLPNWQPNWSVEGGIGTIDATGKFTATNTQGVGKVDAYFYIKDKQFLFRSPDITIGSASALPVVKLDILASNISGHPNDGIAVFDAAGGTGFLDQNVFSITSGASDNDLLTKDNNGTFYVQDYDGNPPTIYTVKDGTKKALPQLPLTSSYRSAAAAITVLPDGHLVAAAYTLAIGYNGFTTLQSDGTWSGYQLKNQYSIVRAITVGADGKLYVSGRQNGTVRVDRYAISGDTLTFETTLISAPGNSQFGAIGFAHNGDMILADTVNHQLQAFTTSGATTSKVFPLPSLGRFVVAHSVLQQNDEVLFVIGRNGLYRVDYTSGDFKAVDPDSAQNPKTFLPFPNGGTFKDLTLN